MNIKLATSLLGLTILAPIGLAQKDVKETSQNDAKKKLESDDELYEGKQYKNAFANPVDHPDRPNVLLIGDSISIGYTIAVRKELGNKADVFRIPGNGRFSGYGVAKIDTWLKGRKWDVIHFNWGLWDLCYRNPESKAQGNRDKINGRLTATPEQYGQNLAKLIAKLKATNAKLIWCQTTPVPKGEAGRIEGDAIKYNAVADRLMRRNGIAINKLHAHALSKLPAIAKAKGDVHFTKEGYKHLAEKVASEIRLALPSQFQFQEPIALTYEGGEITTTGTVEGKRGSGYSSAHFTDLNGDNKKDIITGDVFGNMRVYLNISTDQTYKFAKPRLLRLANGDIAAMKNW